MRSTRPTRAVKAAYTHRLCHAQQVGYTVPMQNSVSLPRVGESATVSYWTDSYAATITAVSKSGHRLTLRALNEIVVSGSTADGSAEYRYETYPEGVGQTWTATRRQNGKYRLLGFEQGGLVSIGFARAYRDPSF